MIGLGMAALIASLVGTAATVVNQQVVAHQDRKHSSALQEDAQKFQEEMRATNYQASVEDMEKAGLNPAMLYGSGGAGLSTTPSSAVGSAGSHNAGNMFNVAQLGEFMNSITNARALDYKMQGKETYTTKTIYNNAGKLVSEIIQDTVQK